MRIKKEKKFETFIVVIMFEMGPRYREKQFVTRAPETFLKEGGQERPTNLIIFSVFPIFLDN